MTWEERILNSDAGKGSREIAEKMVREGREKRPVIVDILGNERFLKTFAGDPAGLD